MKGGASRNLPEREISAVMALRCAQFGCVTRVAAYGQHESAGPVRPMAMVYMATRRQAEKVAAAFGGRTVGNVVVVFLDGPGFAAARAVRAPRAAFLPDRA